MVYVRPNLDEVVAGMPVVQARVKAQAEGVEHRIKAAILPHNKSNDLFDSVEVVRAFKGKDYWIHIKARYAVPANYGFIHHWTHKRVKGINFIKIGVYGG